MLGNGSWKIDFLLCYVCRKRIIVCFFIVRGEGEIIGFKVLGVKMEEFICEGIVEVSFNFFEF